MEYANTQDSPQKGTLNIEQFKQLYHQFDRATLAQLHEVYSPAIRFKDPVHQLDGLDALTNYFEHFCSADNNYQFEFTNELITANQAFFQWTMHYTHPQLQHGARLQLEGGSLIKFDQHIYYHEDFYDMGAMIYQHLPIMGWLVKKINARIVGQAQ